MAHGGKREGAGRKLRATPRELSPEVAKITMSASISRELYAALHAHHAATGGRFSDTVEHFLRLGLDATPETKG